MALDERFIPINLLNDYYVNKDTAEALANGTLTFFRDSARSTPKTVYELVKTGGVYSYVALPNPVTLNAAGTAQNAAGDNVAIYLFPFEGDPDDNSTTLDLYYIVAEDSNGGAQWVREAVPNLEAGNNPINDTGRNNALSNPQFSRYFLIDDATTLTVSSASQVFPIAPDWDLVASGSGSIVITRVPVDGNEKILTFPSYYLSINVGSGVTNPFLRQRLKKNSGIWSGTFLSGFFAAKSGVGSNSVTMKYQDSSGSTSDVDIFDAALTSAWDTYGGSIEIGDSSNTQSGDDAHVDIVIELPPSNTTDITSIQVIATDSELFGDVQTYDKRSANREQAFMGDYYIPRLEYKNIPSLLVGWDFPLNPGQFGSSGSVGGGTAEYIIDQTILQTRAGLTVNWSKSTKTNGLSLNHAQADLSYALIQYLDGAQAAKFVGTPLSVNVNGYTVAGGNAAGITEIQVKIFANSASNQFGTLPTSLFDIAANGTITLTATAVTNGWYEITRKNLPVAKGKLNPLASTGVIAENNDIGFNNWVIEDNAEVTAGVQGVAVVVSFVPASSTTDYETQVDSISVIPGDIPTRPAPLSKEATIQACQYYYEKSYAQGSNPGSVVESNSIATYMLDEFATNRHRWYRNQIFLPYKQTKRAAPASAGVTIYSPGSPTANTIRHTVYNGTSTAVTGGGIMMVPSPATVTETFTSNYAKTHLGTESATFRNSSTAFVIEENGSSLTKGDFAGMTEFHYTIDSRIGA